MYIRMYKFQSNGSLYTFTCICEQTSLYNMHLLFVIVFTEYFSITLADYATLLVIIDWRMS